MKPPLATLTDERLQVMLENYDIILEGATNELHKEIYQGVIDAINKEVERRKQ